MSALPNFTIKELMDAGVHFGHKTMRWNPKMQQFIYGSRNNIHIIDLQKTAPMLRKALTVANQVASRNGRILFVATKNQASSVVAEAAERCGQYFVNHRWMGGMLTNWETVSKSIKKLNSIEKQLEDPELNLVKKERLHLSRQAEKLELALGGIRRMGGKPDLIIIIDTNREKIALQEARKLDIPTIAIADTNSDPEEIDYIVPGNDDSIKSIRLFCNLFSDAILSGLQQSVGGYKQEQQAANDSQAEEKQVAQIKAEEKSAEEKKVEEGEAKAEEASDKQQAEAQKVEAQKEDTKKEEAQKEAKKAPAKKSTAKKATTKKAEAEEAEAEEGSQKKEAESKPAAKKPAAKKAPAKKEAPKKEADKKTTAKKSAAKKDESAKDEAKKAPAKKETAKKTAAKKSTAKKADDKSDAKAEEKKDES